MKKKTSTTSRTTSKVARAGRRPQVRRTKKAAVSVVVSRPRRQKSA